MLSPRKLKYRKSFRGKRAGYAQRGSELAFGQYGIKSLDTGWVTARQIESARRAMTRYVRRGGQIWIRIFPDKPITKKGNEVPMGAGKGAVDHYVTPVKIGTMLFEMEGIPADKAKEALELAGYKLPCKVKFISV